jgi:uncharacterized SAM-binding protein YcdF (DUF218 family)
MMYVALALSAGCLLYYLVCAGYAGVSSSFIFVWLIGAAVFGGISAELFLESRGIQVLPALVKRVICVVLVCGFALLFAMEGLIISCMTDKPSDSCEYMIVLGCQIRGSTITRSLKKRLDTAYEYAKDSDIMIIVSGGRGKGEDMSEAQAMRDYLAGRGIDEKRIIMEDKSTDTSENIRNSAEIIGDMSASVCVVTNNFHVYRAKKLAYGCGFTEVSGAAAESDRVLLLNYMVREAVGIVKDFVFGNFNK